jgi:hypothetical protein
MMTALKENFMNQNAIYQGYFDNNLSMRKFVQGTSNMLIVMPNLVMGGNVINVVVEHYSRETVCTHMGIHARNGAYHQQPRYAKRWANKPYSTRVLALADFKRIYEGIELIEM